MAGTFVWYELMTTDAAAACSFYTQVLGWTQAPSGMPGMDYTLVSAGPHQVAGVMPLPAEAAAAGAPPAWIGYVSVDDVDVASAAVQAAGGQICHPPTDIPTIGRFSTVADPHGAVVCLFRGSDGRAVELPHHYPHAWKLKDGSFVLTDSASFDPQRDLGLAGERLQRAK